MVEQVKLMYLANVFDVTPTFMQPIFTDGSEFYLQEIENDKIAFFSKLDMECLSDSVLYEVKPQEYSIGEAALYTIQLPNSCFIFGNSKKILSYYREHISDFDKYPLFVNKMHSFQKELGIVIKYLPAQCQSLVCAEDKMVQSTSIERKVKITLLSKRNKLLGMPSTWYNLTYNYMSEFSRNISKYDNVFSFREYYKDFRISREKRNELNQLLKNHFFPGDTCSLFVQLTVINCIMQITPYQYAARVRHRRSLKQQRNSIPLSLFRTTLWTNKQVCLLLTQASGGSRHDIQKFEPTFENWRLGINPPIIKQNDIYDYSASNWAYYLEAQEELIYDENNAVFWLETKKLSSSTCSIVAQNYRTYKIHFAIKTNPITDKCIIHFIESLYKDVRRKVVLLFLESDESNLLFSEQLSEWLNQNEEKCTLIEDPRKMQVYQ